MHPEVKRMREAEAMGRPMPPLPTPLRSRPHIFFQFSINRKDVGRVVVELFDDILPAPARHVQARCTSAARDTFAGTCIHKILGGTSIYGGKSRHYTDVVSMKRDSSLRHVAAGTLSVSEDGGELCFSLAKALQLDDTHQVIGQITKGREIIERIAQITTKGGDDFPSQPVVVEKCGLTDADGAVDVEISGGKLGVEGEGVLDREEDATKNAVAEALGKKKPQKGGSSGDLKKKKKSKFDDVLLGGSSSGDESSSDDDEG
jgi:cyclophilin family peptidyl-prolyl cis-trans isomerase